MKRSGIAGLALLALGAISFGASQLFGSSSAYAAGGGAGGIAVSGGGICNAAGCVLPNGARIMVADGGLIFDNVASSDGGAMIMDWFPPLVPFGAMVFCMRLRANAAADLCFDNAGNVYDNDATGSFLDVVVGSTFGLFEGPLILGNGSYNNDGIWLLGQGTPDGGDVAVFHTRVQASGPMFEVCNVDAGGQFTNLAQGCNPGNDLFNVGVDASYAALPFIDDAGVQAGASPIMIGAGPSAGEPTLYNDGFGNGMLMGSSGQGAVLGTNGAMMLLCNYGGSGLCNAAYPFRIDDGLNGMPYPLNQTLFSTTVNTVNARIAAGITLGGHFLNAQGATVQYLTGYIGTTGACAGCGDAGFYTLNVTDGTNTCTSSVGLPCTATGVFSLLGTGTAGTGCTFASSTNITVGVGATTDCTTFPAYANVDVVGAYHP